MTEFTKLEVGKPSPFPSKLNFDGGHFEADQNGFLFLIYLSGMKAKEKRSFKSDVVRARTIRDEDKLLTLIRFGSSPLIFELSFDPTLYKDERAYDLIEKTNTVQIICIDSKDNTLQVLRLVSMPNELRNTWHEYWERARNDANFSQEYTRWLNSLYSSHSVINLWNKAKNAGSFGR